MLAAEQRMRRGVDFTSTFRRGGKGSTSRLVVHMAVVDEPTDPGSVGFVVSKSVGGAVVRNRVKRRLRHLMRVRMESQWRGRRIVVRALPAAAAADHATLSGDLDTCLATADRRLAAGGGGR